MGEAGLRPPHGVGLHAPPPEHPLHPGPAAHLVRRGGPLVDGDSASHGVVRPTAASFEIVHYQLSIAVPNDVIPQVTGAIKAFESK